MSSYSGAGEAGAWDGGPPGAEADYAPPLPTTDPWTGASYGYPPYDQYQGYGSYGYSYDGSYYPRADGYYDTGTYPPPPPAYEYPSAPDAPHAPRADYRPRRDYERGAGYEDRRRRRSRSASDSKYAKYSSSDRSSSKSRSYSRSPKKIKKERRSTSGSSRSRRSYGRPSADRSEHSLTPPLKHTKARSRNRSKNKDRSRSSPVTIKREKKSTSKGKSAPSFESKSRGRRERDVFTPPRKNPADIQKTRRRSGGSGTPPIADRRSEKSPRRKNQYKDRKSNVSPRTPRDSSVTPPRCYARNRSSSRSRSRSRSLTPKTKRKRSRTPKQQRKRSSSSSSTSSSASSRSKRRARRQSTSGRESRSESRSRGRSTSRRHSSSRFKSRRSRSPKKSKSPAQGRSSGSLSGTPSDEECRGHFTVEDRKRYWKMHKSRQVRAGKPKSPPREEVRPPPGAVETSHAVDVQYGDPPEVEGPNYAELLQHPAPASHAASSSKSKPIPIPIKNDGSFLEMFKKMQEQTKKVEEVETKPVIKKPVLPFIGKRRGGRVLKTGLVKKAKAIDEQTVDNTPKDAWSLYMQEVKKYRETSCEEERKTRPLVK